MTNDNKQMFIAASSFKLRKPGNYQPLVIAKSKLLSKYPFYATILLDQMTLWLTDDIPTLATDGKKILINPEYFEDVLSPPLRISALCHEISHAMLLHLPRAKKFLDLGFEGDEFHLVGWNVAGDFYINSLLEDCGLQLHPGWLRDNTWNHEFGLVDDIYRDILKKYPPPPPPPPGPGAGGGGMPGDEEGSGDGDGDESEGGSSDNPMDQGTQDTHLMPESTSQADDDNMKRTVQAAAEVAKAQGLLPGALERFVGDFLEPQVDWKARLAAIVARVLGTDAVNWSRPHRRRLVATSVWFPRRTGHSAGTVVVGVDTSGSIGDDEIAAFLGELADILTNTNPQQVYLCWCDAAIGRVDELTTASDLAVAVKAGCPGGGGTSFVPVFNWCEEENIRPDTLIYFTDMYGTFPSEDPGYPTIWCRTTEGHDAPFGEHVHIDIGHGQG